MNTQKLLLLGILCLSSKRAPQQCFCFHTGYHLPTNVHSLQLKETTKQPLPTFLSPEKKVVERKEKPTIYYKNKKNSYVRPLFISQNDHYDVFDRENDDGPSEEGMDLSRPGDVPGSVLALGENRALTYLKSGSKCLDLFFDTVPGMRKESLVSLLDDAWSDSPSTTLKIIFQMGDPRQGKGDLRNYYVSMVWLYENQFDTFMQNLKFVPQFAYYKALLDILQLVCLSSSPYRRDISYSSESERKEDDEHLHLLEDFFESLKHRNDIGPDLLQWNAENCKEEGKHYSYWKDDKMRDLFIDYQHSRNKEKSMRARIARKVKFECLKANADTRRKIDPKYSAFYSAVADIFANDLKKEQEIMTSNETISLSGLVAKWAPTPKQSHDKNTKIVDGIVERLFPENQYKIPGGTHADYLKIMGDRYRKEYLVPQRRRAEIPEHFTGTGDWNLVNYKRMASNCRRRHGHIYEKYDAFRYQEYIKDAILAAKEGNLKLITAGALLPHEIIECANKGTSTQNDEANLQWMRLLEDTKKSGTLPSAVAICDVSGSMHGTPMSVAIALSLLVSDVADEPWKNKMITFSETPQFVSVTEARIDNLAQRRADVQRMPWGMNTNFQAVFDLILDSAKFFGIKSTEMPEILFCFTDMEFDQSFDGQNAWKTDLEMIRFKYAAANFPVPHLVFWNLRPSRSRPSSCFEPGVSMLSGFSAGMMKSFLSFQLEEATPIAQLESALSPYEVLKVALPNDITSGS